MYIITNTCLHCNEPYMPSRHNEACASDYFCSPACEREYLVACAIAHGVEVQRCLVCNVRHTNATGYCSQECADVMSEEMLHYAFLRLQEARR